MHRHGYTGRKFGRTRDPRRALLKSLATSLVEEERIVTTLPKAKEVVPYVEKLVTKAKKGGLHNRRQVISKLQTKESAHKLFEVVAPSTGKRTSGFLRIEKTGSRRGDGASMAAVSFVDEIKEATAKPAKAPKTTTAPKATTKKPAAKKPAKATAEKTK